MMDDLDRAIVNALQRGFPICESPFREVADQLGTDEAELIARLEGMVDDGLLSRFGPMYHAGQMGGALTLAAMAVPEDRFESVAAIVNGFKEVAHNYARDHRLNMWFVIATERPDQVVEVIDKIARETGLEVYNLPKEEKFYVGLHFTV